MTPEDAESFYEEDEPPAAVFARFDAGPHGVTPGRAGLPAEPGEYAAELVFPAEAMGGGSRESRYRHDRELRRAQDTPGAQA